MKEYIKKIFGIKATKEIMDFTHNMRHPIIHFIPNSKKLKLQKAVSRWNKNINVFIGEKITTREKDLYFCPYNSDDVGSIFLHYKTDIFLDTLMRDLGIAKSTSEAKGAGWHKKANDGFSEIYLDNMKEIKTPSWNNAKKPHRITILKRLHKDNVIV